MGKRTQKRRMKEIEERKNREYGRKGEDKMEEKKTEVRKKK